MSPEDSLWLEILKNHPELWGKSASDARSFLRERGFPEHLIDAFVNG